LLINYLQLCFTALFDFFDSFNGVRYPLVGGTRSSRFDGTGLSVVYSFLARRLPHVRCTQEDGGAIILGERNRRAWRNMFLLKVYSESASLQAVQSSGDALGVSPAVHRGFRLIGTDAGDRGNCPCDRQGGVPDAEYKVDYETISVEEYEKKYRDQQFKYMRKKAAKLGYQLVPA
jgi:hypothetical protein